MNYSFLSRIVQRILLGSITLYQTTLSPDHGLLRPLFPQGVCRFHPTCSDYAKASIKEYGLSGIWMALARIARCHPWAAGGIDPVPLKK